MSQPSQEGRGIRAGFSRWRASGRGRKTLKAAYAQAARDVKRMDPAVRERIGRANLTKSDLQQLASFHVDAQFRPGQYGDMSQRLGQAANNRLQQAGPAPRQPRISRTRNPVRALVNRYSRWGRNQRRGTKALKAALKQAARDVKRTDPAVRLAIGRSTLNSADLAALAAGRMDQVFRPEGRAQGVPAQQQGRGQAQGSGMIQSRDAARQVPAQSEQLTQQIIALQQSILESQRQQMTLLQEINQLQAQMRQMLGTRVQDLQQQLSDPEQAVSPPELTQQPEMDPARQSPDGQQPQRENTDDHVRLDNPVIPAKEGPEGEQQSSGEAEAAGDPQAQGDEPQLGEGAREGEAERGDGEVQAGNTGPQTASTEEVTAAWVNVPENPEASVVGPEESGTDGVQNDGEVAAQQPAQAEPTAETQQPGTTPQQPAVAGQQPGATPQQPGATPQQPGATPQQPGATPQQPGATPQQPGATPQQPGATPQQPGATPQQPGATPQQPGVSGQQVGGDPRRAGVNEGAGKLPAAVGAGETSQEMLDAKFARDVATSGQKPLGATRQPTKGAGETSQETEEARRALDIVASGQKPPTARTPTQSRKPDSRRDGR